MGMKPFVLNICFTSEEALIAFFNENFWHHENKLGLYEADSEDQERWQSVQQYVVRSVINIRTTDPLSVRGGYEKGKASES